MTTGAVYIDLAGKPPESRRRELGQLAPASRGSIVIVSVGALPVDAQLIWLLAEYTERRRLRVQFQGDTAAVALWWAALQHGIRFSALTLACELANREMVGGGGP